MKEAPAKDDLFVGLGPSHDNVLYVRQSDGALRPATEEERRLSFDQRYGSRLMVEQAARYNR